MSDAPEAVAWLKRRFEALKASDPSDSAGDFSSVCQAMARSNSRQLADLLFDGALNTTGKTQGDCIGAIGEITSEKALSVLKQLAEGKRTDGVFTRLDDIIKDLEGRLRALRPMAEVLEKEAKQ